VAEPLVSVVLLTHNRPIWLSEAVSSVLNGDFCDFELIVSNNGDPRHTRALATSYPDQRIRWIEQDQSLDIARHTIAALSLAGGKYVAVLHDDDEWAPGFLSALVPIVECSDDIVLAFTDHYCMRQDGSVDHRETVKNSRRWGREELRQGVHKPFFEIVARQCVPLTGSLMRRSALSLEVEAGVDEFFDIWITYLLASTGGAAYYDNERLLYKRVHSHNANCQRSVNAKFGAIHGRHLMLDDPRMRPYARIIRTKLARSHLSVALALLRQRERRLAISHICESLRTRPSLLAASGLAAVCILPSRTSRSVARMVR
jgi:glycosyltransferase involved in cell wall biosynthesis